MADRESVLEEIGMTSNEARVYLALLRLGSSTPGGVIKKLGLHRRTAYDCLERLMEKGLVAYAEVDGKKVYQTSDPKLLLEIIHGREEQVQALLPELIHMQKSSKKKQEVHVYKGKKGMKTVFEDILITGKDYVVIGATSQPEEHLLKYYYPDFQRRRIKKGIKRKMIYASEVRDMDVECKDPEKIPLSEIRFLPQGYAAPTTTLVYGDKAIIFIQSEEPTSIVIDNEKTAKGFREYARLLWNIAKK
ncbi:MAG: helix-turn-helix domain-containing protein [Candidatus Altiarchaeota archaeon]